MVGYIHQAADQVAEQVTYVLDYIGLMAKQVLDNEAERWPDAEAPRRKAPNQSSRSRLGRIWGTAGKPREKAPGHAIGASGQHLTRPPWKVSSAGGT